MEENPIPKLTQEQIVRFESASALTKQTVQEIGNFKLAHHLHTKQKRQAFQACLVDLQILK